MSDDVSVRLRAEDNTSPAFQSVGRSIDQLAGKAAQAGRAGSEMGGLAVPGFKAIEDASKRTGVAVDGWRARLLAGGQALVRSTIEQTHVLDRAERAERSRAASMRATGTEQGAMASRYLSISAAIEVARRSLLEFSHQSDRMNVLQNQIGASPEEIGKVREMVKRTSLDIGVANQEIEKTFSSLRANGNLTIQQAEALAPRVVTAARAFGVAGPAMAAGLGAFLNNLRVSGDEAVNVLDMMVTASSKFHLNLEELNTSAPHLGETMREMGYTGEAGAARMLAMLGVLREHGFTKTSEAATHLNRLLLNMGGNQRLNDAIGVDEKRMRRDMKSVEEGGGDVIAFWRLKVREALSRNETLESLFPDIRSRQAAMAMLTYYDKIAEKEGQLKNVAGAVDNAWKNMVGPQVAIDKMMRSLEELMETVGQFLFTIGANQAIKDFTAILRDLGASIEYVDGLIKKGFWGGIKAAANDIDNALLRNKATSPTLDAERKKLNDMRYDTGTPEFQAKIDAMSPTQRAARAEEIADRQAKIRKLEDQLIHPSSPELEVERKKLEGMKYSNASPEERAQRRGESVTARRQRALELIAQREKVEAMEKALLDQAMAPAVPGPAPGAPIPGRPGTAIPPPVLDDMNDRRDNNKEIQRGTENLRKMNFELESGASRSIVVPASYSPGADGGGGAPFRPRGGGRFGSWSDTGGGGEGAPAGGSGGADGGGGQPAPRGSSPMGGGAEAGAGRAAGGGRMTRGDRNNNPGNLKMGPFARAHGATGADDRGFAVFPDRDTGSKAQGALLSKNYNNMTLEQMGQKYAEGDPNWSRNVAKHSGLEGGVPINTQDPETLSKLQRGISGAEGTSQGGRREASLTPGGGEGRRPGPMGEGGGAVPADILKQAEVLAAKGDIGAVREFMRDQGYAKSEAWCGQFAASVVRSQGGTPPKGYAVASNWRNWGDKVEGTPQPGDVAVRRTGRTGEQGSHVTFVKSVDPKTGKFMGLGGNQGGTRGNRLLTSSKYDLDAFTFRRSRARPEADGRPQGEFPPKISAQRQRELQKGEPSFPAENAPYPSDEDLGRKPAADMTGSRHDAGGGQGTPGGFDAGRRAKEGAEEQTYGGGKIDMEDARRQRQELEQPITIRTQMDAGPDAQFRRASMRRETDRELREQRWDSYNDIGAA